MPILQSLRRHMAVARQAMVDDRLVKAEAGINPKARRDELAFLPAVLEVSETPPSPLGRVIAWTIIAFAVITVLWAVIGRMDIIAVAQGRIIPTERVKLVQPRDAGVVRAIHVTEGQAVRTGDVLIELDPTETQASIDQLTTDLVATLLDLARLEALLEPDPQKAFSAPADAPAGLVALYRDYFTSQVRERRAREEVLVGEVRVRRSEVATLRAEVGHLDTMLPRLRDRIGKRRALLDKGVIPHLAFTEEEDSLVNMEGRRSVTAQRLVEVEAALAKAEQDLDHADSQFRREVHAELSQTRVRLAVLEQEIRKARDRSQRQTLVAPIDGTVQGLNIHTIGGVVIEAQQLMSLVPADTGLEAEVFLLNKDSGFVYAGQEAEIKIESFPFTKYGTIDGKVVHVSPDAIEGEQHGLIYPARVLLARETMQADGKTIRLTPGMAVTAEIKTGKRHLVEYILAPIKRYANESLKER